MSTSRPRARARAGAPVHPPVPDPATAALDLLLRVLADLDPPDACDGVVIWLLDGRSRLTGLLAGPPTWPIADAITDLLIEHALEEEAEALIVVRRRAGPPGVEHDDLVGFAAFDAACARVDLPVLWHLVDAGGEVCVRELR